MTLILIFTGPYENESVISAPTNEHRNAQMDEQTRSLCYGNAFNDHSDQNPN